MQQNPLRPPARAAAARIARQLATFVDRDAELQRFRHFLQSDDSHIFIVCGESGSGKSSLLMRMVHECSVQDVRKAEVLWSETRSYGFMGVMRKLRDDLGADSFKPFTDLINYYTKNEHRLSVDLGGIEQINVADGASITNAKTGDLAGVIIKDFMINTPRSDMDVPEHERMVRLTETFLDNLQAVAAKERLVLFMDATEKMTTDTERWLWGEFLPAVRDGLVERLLVVLCGQKRPELNYDWQPYPEVAELRPLELAHIAEYLRRRGVPEDEVSPVARAFLVTTEGHVWRVATKVDAYLRLA